MKKIALLFLIASLYSCGGMKPFKVSQIESIHFVYDDAENVNFGSTVNGKVVARFLNGKELDISDNKRLEFASIDVTRDGTSNYYKIVKRPTTFDDDFATITLSVTDKEETFRSFDTLRMNFKGDLTIDCSGKDGEDGIDQKNKGGRILIRDGKNGENGTDGTNGESADSYTAHVWEEDATIYVSISSIDGLNTWKYKSTGGTKVRFDVSGGNGGKGGDGGDGGPGKDGKQKDEDQIEPGDGGDGGNGGNGGNGGDGGTVTVYLHQDSKRLEPNINFNTLGGESGKGGIGGKAGEPGDPLEGQAPGNYGSPGSPGLTGVRGSNGAVPIVEIQNFSIGQFK